MSLVAYALLSWFGEIAVASVQQCQIISREGWGAMPTNWTEPFPKMPLNHVFIHHTAGPECEEPDRCANVVRGIQRYHAIDRNWGDIGYNFLIGGDGRIYEGRGWTQVGAQVYGFNRISIGIALLGNYQNKAPSDFVLTQAKNLIACGKSLNFISSTAKIHGHRDGYCTECPGNSLASIIKTWPDYQGGPLPGYRC